MKYWPTLINLAISDSIGLDRKNNCYICRGTYGSPTNEHKLFTICHIIIVARLLIKTVGIAIIRMLCFCLRRWKCSLCWRNMTFNHLRIDMFKILFEDDEMYTEVYLNALVIILSTTSLSSLSKTRLIDLTRIVDNVPPMCLTCTDFFSIFRAEYSICRCCEFWDLYLLIIAKTQHYNTNVLNPLIIVDDIALVQCPCMRIIDQETFSFLISERHHLKQK